MLDRICLLAGAIVVLSGCDRQIESPEQKPAASPGLTLSDDASAPEIADLHNYREKDGDLYMYVSAASEEDEKKGVAIGHVLMFRYLGKEDGKHILNSVTDSGRVLLRSECSDPCKIITRVDGSGAERIPYDTRSVIGSAFEDAINGKLEISKKAAKQPTERMAEATAPPRIPAAFVDEWNEDTSACGTGTNDSRLRVKPTKVEFYESDAQVRSVEIHNARAVTVQGSFAGEGQAWNNSFKMVLSRSGNDLTIDGLTRHRCQ